MRRVAFLTDLHICRELRWAECQRILEWSACEIEREIPDAITLGGDFFDRKPDVGEMRVLAEWLVRLGNVAPVYGVAGNHDPAGMSVFDLLEAVHPITIAERPVVVPGDGKAHGLDFVLLPWPRKAQLLAMLGDVGKEEARLVGGELLLDVLRGLAAPSHSEAGRCFVGHVQLRGAKVSVGQPLAPGADFEIGLEDLALAACDAYLLGHIHRPDDMLAGGMPAVYGGSFRRCDFGEVEEKSLVYATFTARGAPAQIERVRIPCTPLLLIEDEWTPNGWFRGESQHDSEIQGAEIRFRYSVAADQREAARDAANRDAAELLARGAAAVKVEDEVKPVGAARAPEVARALTLRAKLEALWAVQGTTPDSVRAARLLSMADGLEEAAHAV